MGDAATPVAGSDPSVVWRTLHLLLAPEPGRLRNTLIQVASVLVIAVIWEVFRIPETSVACYFVLFTNRNTRTATSTGAIGVGVLGTIATLATILVLMIGLSEPAIRICLMAALSFCAMLMSRASTAGTGFFAAGFLVVYALTSADSIQGSSLQSGMVSNTTSGGLPNILFMPPEESLLHGLLWFIAVVVIPAVIVALINKAFGRDPARILQRELRARIDACAAFCEGKTGASAKLEAIARGSTPKLFPLAALAQKDHGAKDEPLGLNQDAIRAVNRLMLVCLAVDRTRASGERPRWMTAAAQRCRALRTGDGRDVAGPTINPDDSLGREVAKSLDRLAEAQRAKADPTHRPDAESKQGFLTENPWSAANVQFALKVTLSVMICYGLVNALDWPGIGTAVTTAFFVALGSVGESGHKMALRICGALLGSALGIGSIILLMPLMTDLADLLPLLAVATFIGAWVGSGSQRVAYAGLQISFAFFIVVLQGYGPVTDMEAAKNRVVGILVGNVVSYLVMTLIWPVRVRHQVVTMLADAMNALGDLLSGRQKLEAARERFSMAIVKTQDMLLDGLYEAAPPDKPRMSDAVIERVEGLILPVSMIAAGLGADSTPERKQALATWFDDVAGRLREDRLDAGSVALPIAALATADDETAWLLLERDLTAVLTQTGLRLVEPA